MPRQAKFSAGDPGAALDLRSVTAGILSDLAQLRAGKIGVAEARVRASLAHEALRGFKLMVEASRILADQAKPVAQIGSAD